MSGIVYDMIRMS